MTDNAKVSVTVTNTGKRAGDEIVQLYIRDLVSSVTRPVMELKDFKRISLAPGESKTVEFVITPDKLSFLDLNMKSVVEPGWFDIMVGTSSVKYETVKLEVAQMSAMYNNYNQNRNTNSPLVYGPSAIAGAIRLAMRRGRV